MEAQEKPIGKFRTILPQVLACFAKNLHIINMGIAMSIPTLVIPSLKGLKSHDNTDILTLTDDQASRYASLSSSGALVSGILLNPLGRKMSMILLNAPMFLHWLLLCSSSSVNGLYAAAIVINMEAQEKPIGKFRTILPQVLACFAKNLHIINMGIAMSIPTLVIPSLKGLKSHDNTDFLTLTDDQASWYASIAFIFQPVGALLSGILFDPLGRKISMILLNAPMFVHWLLLYNASSVNGLYAAGILFGLTTGFLEAPIATYIGEISQPSIRGVLTSTANLSAVIGITIGYLLGSIFTWRVTALICSSVPVITAIAICFVPETPSWLLAKNRREDALKSLMWLRGWVSDPKCVEMEFNEIQRYSEESNRCQMCQRTDTECTHKTSSADLLRELFHKRNLKPSSIVISMFFFCQLNGFTSMRPYLVQIFEAFSVPIDSSVATVWGGIVGLVGCVASTCLIKGLGKRKIAIISYASTSISMLGIAVYAYQFLPAGTNSFNISPNQTESIPLGVIPLIFIYALTFFASFGLIPVPWMLMSEVFPFKTRSISSGITAGVDFILMFGATNVYYNLEVQLGLFGLTTFFTFFNVLGLIYTCKFLPETERRTLEEIELHFSDDTKTISDIKIMKKKNQAIEDSAATPLMRLGKSATTPISQVEINESAYRTKSDRHVMFTKFN